MGYKKLQDNDGHWFWIPTNLVSEFENDLEVITGIEYMDNPDAFDYFIEKYSVYQTGGSPELKPDYYK